MSPRPILIFPAQPFEGAKLEEDFQEQAESAKRAGFSVVTYSLEESRLFAKGIEGVALYRGWMLSPERYSVFYEQLSRAGLRLLTNPEEYRYAHCLPGWYSHLSGVTAESIWFEGRLLDYDSLQQFFGSGPVVLKDYVKSLKHYWNEACYIPDVRDREQVEAVVERFLELREEELQGGLVFRRFLPLKLWEKHPRSGFPMSVEYRLFFFRGRLLARFPAWEGMELKEEPEESFCTALAERVQSPFFSLDVALCEDGSWRVMELGDGQVSGLGGAVEYDSFYATLAELS